MSQNPDSQTPPPATNSSGPKGPNRTVIGTVVALAGAMLLIPSVRNSVYKLLGISEGVVDVIEHVVDHKLAGKDLPGMPPLSNLTIIESGLTNLALKTAWHRTPEGSDVFPVALFRALKDPETGRPFIESFSKFGFTPSPLPNDDTGLPVGFSRIKSPHHDFVLTGFNCAACHSTHISYQGKNLHIDGAPSQLDIEAFFRGTLAAVKGEVENSNLGERAKFILRFIEYNAIDLAKMHVEAEQQPAQQSARPEETAQHDEALAFLKEKIESFVRIVASFERQTPAGPGRADSFGIIRNLMMTEAVVGGAGNFRPMTAPVSIPHLFGFGYFTNLHWDGNTTTGNDRNYAQAIALGANFDPKDLASSVNPYDLYTMESTAWALKPPAWPTDIFGPLDSNKITRGKQLFSSQGCADCHGGEGWHKLSVIGTDPNRLDNFSIPINNGGGKTSSYATNLYTSAIAVKVKAYDKYDVSPADRAKMDKWHDGVEPVWRETLNLGYFTRPLRGVWATAPFLHNNSVPTLWHLLQPAAQRPVKFATGHREYDPQRVGYIENPQTVVWELDTTISGNHNTGHEFGTRLSDEDKWALIEYLKTL